MRIAAVASIWICRLKLACVSYYRGSGQAEKNKHVKTHHKLIRESYVHIVADLT